MWLVCCCLCILSVLSVCRAVPINRDFSSNERAVYVDKSNEKFGNESVCVSDDVLYKEGDPMPTANVCEKCTCRPPKFVCEKVQCDVKPGCRAVQRSNQCCPEYKCDCEKDGKHYQNGERLEDGSTLCKACYCRSGEIVCTDIECYRRDDCEPRYVNGTCCPKYDHCPPLEPTPMTFLTTSSEPSENISPFLTKLEDDFDVAPNNFGDIIQDNAVDSSKRIDILGEILSDSPYLSSDSFSEIEQDASLKPGSSEKNSEPEIFEENMSEIHTERMETTPDPKTEAAEYDVTNGSSEDTTHISEGITETSATEKLSSNTEETTDLTMHSREDPEESIETTTAPTQSHEIETTTTQSHDSVNEDMLGDGGSTKYSGEIKRTDTNSDESKEISLETLPSSAENSQEAGSKVGTVDEILNEFTSIIRETSNDYEQSNSFKNSDEISSEHNIGNERNTEETTVTEVVSTDPTHTGTDEYEVPVLTIASGIASENMSIIIPEPLTGSKTEPKEDASLIHGDDNKETLMDERIFPLSNKNEGEKQIDFLYRKTSSENSKLSSIDVAVSGERITESPMPKEMTDITETKSSEQVTTISSISSDTEITTSARIATTVFEFLKTGAGVSDESDREPETTNNEEIVSTSTKILKATEEKSSVPAETESSSKTEDITVSDELTPTTQNFLEGEHLDNKEETTLGDSVASTTPNVLEGEHPDNTVGGSTEITETTDSNRDISTIPNILEKEHPEIRISESSETGTTEKTEAIQTETTANILEGEHPTFKRSGSDGSEVITENIEASGSGEITTPNVLEGEHPDNSRSSAEEKTDVTPTEDELSTTPKVLEGEHPDNSGSSAEEKTDVTSTEDELSTTPNVLEGEHAGIIRKESSESTTELVETIETTTQNVLEGEHPLMDSASHKSESETTPNMIDLAVNKEAPLINSEISGEKINTRIGNWDKSYESIETTDSTSTTLDMLKGEHPHSNESNSEEAITTTEVAESLESKETFVTTEDSSMIHITDDSRDVTTNSADTETDTVTEHNSSEIYKMEDTQSQKENGLGHISSDFSDNINPTEETETTTYPTTQFTTQDTTMESIEDNSGKILPPVPKSNKTTSLESSENASIASDKEEPLPETWLKLNNETKTDTVTFESNGQSSEESTQTETTTKEKISQTVPPSSSMVNDYSGLIPVKESSLHSEESLDTSFERYGIKFDGSSKESISIDTSAASAESSHSNMETETTTSDYETTTLNSNSQSAEYIAWDFSDKSASQPIEKAHPIEVKESVPTNSAYGSWERWNSNEYYYGSVGSYGNYGSNEMSTTQSSKESTENIQSNKEESNEYEESHSTQTPKEEHMTNSKHESNKDTQEKYSFEYKDASEETTIPTTVSQNITETNTTSKNETETTTPSSSEGSYQIYGDSNTSVNEHQHSAEGTNSQYEETARVKEDPFDFWSGMWGKSNPVI